MKSTRLEQTVLLTPKGAEPLQETILVEQPVEVTLNELVVGASMVLPLNLEEFAAGYLFGQGLISSPDEIVEIQVCPQGRINVYAKVDADETLAKRNELISTSGCGGTGKISRADLEGEFPPSAEFRLGFDQLKELILGTLNTSTLQNDTHCAHGCGLWSEGRLAAAYEDVGRHNAMDKVLGAMLLRRLSPAGAVYTTGRLTSDMVLKCARMGIPIVLSRSSVSSLGLDIARRAGLTLAGYVRPGRVNVFCGEKRIG